MQPEIVTIPCLSDNYAYLIHNPKNGETAAIDVPEARPVRDELQRRHWTLNAILITHHHSDHIDGVSELRKICDGHVIGSQNDSARLPPLDRAISDEESFWVCGLPVKSVPAYGHTIGHLAYLFENAVFTGDSLMVMGCGRLFEGTPEMMWDTLCRLSQLAGETLICSGHEYTEANTRFALTVDPENDDLVARQDAIRRARQAGRATVPAKLSLECATNPFLRAGNPSIKRAAGMPAASDLEMFAELRRRKDNF